MRQRKHTPLSGWIAGRGSNQEEIMGGLTPEQMRRLHDFAEQLAELAEHQEDQWKVQIPQGSPVCLR
ncbi:hypothetical protein ACFV2Q_29530 [Streptomyces sp. NPDC059650]|uniref:hypothetical protein n=1 Tax=Streptomyces sp. NPDC059650 TaxID=3346896 RepID=UPI0036A85695